MEVATALTTDSLLWTDNTTNATSTTTSGYFNTTIDGNKTTSINTDTIDPQLSPIFMAVYFSVRLLFSGLAIFGNLLTIIAVVRFEILQNNTNFLICSLAVADIIGASITPLNISHYVLWDRPIFIPLCLIDKGLSVISLAVNIYSILWIAIDRYFYIAHGLYYPLWFTRTKMFIVIGLTWLIITIEVIVIFVILNKLEIGMTCKFPVYLVQWAYIGIIVPQFPTITSVTVAFHVAISCVAYKQGKAIAALNQPYDTHEAAVHRQQKKIAKMMLTVLGTYFACYVPQVTVSLILSTHSRTIYYLQIEKITVLMYWANTWLNPIIYAWKSEDFRVCFRKLLGLKPSNTVNPMMPN